MCCVTSDERCPARKRSWFGDRCIGIWGCTPRHVLAKRQAVCGSSHPVRVPISSLLSRVASTSGHTCADHMAPGGGRMADIGHTKGSLLAHLA